MRGLFGPASVPRRATRTVTFWIESAPALDFAVPLARAMLRRYPRIDIVFLQDQSLSRDHGFDTYPPPTAASTAWMLTRLRTHTLVLGGVDGARRHRISEHAAQRGSFQILIDDDDAATSATPYDAVLDPTALTPDEAAARLQPVVGSSRRQRLRQRGYVPTSIRILRFVRQGPLRPLFASRFREYASIESLRTALGAPESLLCLGNGPSSRHPGLEAMACERVFRVNHSWKERGGPFLSPDLVFTGQRDTVMQVHPNYGYVFGKIESEEKILSKLLATRRRLAFCTAERLGVYAKGCDGRAMPTNGALMIAVAVALRPRRIVIAGIDLFSDPAGAYPGDSVTQNAYALGHDPSFEREYILSALRRHDGELVVFGEPLKAVLDEAGIAAGNAGSS